jgi:hypothetical protein
MTIKIKCKECRKVARCNGDKEELCNGAIEEAKRKKRLVLCWCAECWKKNHNGDPENVEFKKCYRGCEEEKVIFT